MPPRKGDYLIHLKKKKNSKNTVPGTEMEFPQLGF
jgi:hypothetical protein